MDAVSIDRENLDSQLLTVEQLGTASNSVERSRDGLNWKTAFEVCRNNLPCLNKMCMGVVSIDCEILAISDVDYRTQPATVLNCQV